ncbi:MAG: hemolysin III family protein [Bacteroidota bacterium]|nr:hemolysin III family protein [Bacteroidota bacterium]
MPYRVQTTLEENVNAVTHGLGVILSLIFMPFLIIKALHSQDVLMVWGVSVFSFGMLAVYMSSTIYHSLREPKLKRLANIVDHISIFFLIGGTYTPIILHYIPERTATVFLTVQWSVIFAGIVLKLFFTGKYEWLSVSLYIVLGWMLVFVIKPLIITMPSNIFFWIIAGGVCYTFGVVFYVLENKKHAHNIWHCFVLAGTILHFIAVYKSIDIAVIFN